MQLDYLPTFQLAGLWAALSPVSAATSRAARRALENEMIARALKGGPGSGNWGHTAFTRAGQVGGSDPGGGATANPIGYLAAFRRAIREEGPVRRQVMDELQAGHPDWHEDTLDLAIGVMELDREKFMHYAEKWGLSDPEAKADAFFKESKARSRAMYEKQMDLQDRMVLPDPSGHGYRFFHAELSERLDMIARRQLVGADLAEAQELFFNRYGLQVNVGTAYDPATAHKELSWLANMLDADPNLRAIYTGAFDSVRFHNSKHGTAAMQVTGKQVSVYPTLHNPYMWYHEAGHGLESLAGEAGVITFEEIGKIFGQGRMSSSYGFANYQEDFAESWVTISGGQWPDEYARWAPKKAAIIRRAIGVLHD